MQNIERSVDFQLGDYHATHRSRQSILWSMDALGWMVGHPEVVQCAWQKLFGQLTGKSATENPPWRTQ
jgi:hypothetical protein